MKVTFSFKTLVTIFKTTWSHILDHNLFLIVAEIQINLKLDLNI